MCFIYIKTARVQIYRNLYTVFLARQVIQLDPLRKFSFRGYNLEYFSVISWNFNHFSAVSSKLTHASHVMDTAKLESVRVSSVRDLPAFPWKWRSEVIACPRHKRASSECASYWFVVINFNKSW